MSAVVLILAIPLLASVLVYLLRRWPLPSTAVAGLAALLLGALMWRWPSQGSLLFLGRAIRTTQPVVIFGQDLQLNPASQWVIGLMAITLAAAYLGAWQVSQGRSFFPFGLILLALLSTVLLIQPPWRAPAILAAALSFGALVVQAGRQGSTRGALRLLCLPVLAIPLFLLAAWYADQAPLDPDDLLPVQTAVQLASLGLVLLLAPWPLHGPWLSAGEEAPPLVAAWLLTALAVIGVTLLQIFLTRFAWLQDASITFGLLTARLPDILVYGGLAGALWAGLAALVQRDLSRQWSYGALFSYSLVLIALGLGARSSWGLTWLLLLSRSAALTVSGFGLAVIRQRSGGGTDHDSVRGLGTRLPWSSAAFLLGGLALAGLPLTIGFAGQWALVQALGSQDWLQSVIVLVSALGLAGGFLRSQRVLLGQLENLLVEREGRLMALLAGLGILVVVWPALFPSVWRSILSAAVAAFTITPVGP
jgi:formate hydrogenlyase subunit 3/multisubunit Na+/H+ antiporter MnhD subunit